MVSARSFTAHLPERPGPILVVGDLICDHYVMGDVERISPEAPVPVLRWDSQTDRPGGAANVALNLAALGCHVRLAGLIGDDEPGKRLLRLLHAGRVETGGIVVSRERPTSLKTRVIARGQHVLRIDRETHEPASPDEEKRLTSAIHKLDGKIRAVVCADYAKGVLGRNILSTIAGLNGGPLVVVDPKGRDFSKYEGATVVTPNERELMDAVPDNDARIHDDAVIERRATKLLNDLDLGAVLVTRGANGMDLFESRKRTIRRTRIPAAQKRQVFDVTGAGDTVAAVLTLGIAGGLSLVEAARLANAAASFVVGIVGTAAPDPEVLSRFLASRRQRR
jgi:D-beta-D-heptose 7-phosphate kinase/D-beta-D-heptose 1-phosphate adenosyltransferase